MKKIVTAFLIFCNLLSILAVNALAKNETTVDQIKKYYSAVNERDWDTYASLWTEQECESFKGFFADPNNAENKAGILNVIKADLVEVVPFDVSSEYDLLSIFPPYMICENMYSGELQAYLCKVDLQVYKEDKYHRNDIDFQLFIFAQENGVWKLASSLPKLKIR